MKIVNGFKLRTIGGENIVAGEGVEQVNFNKLIALNQTAAWLWRELESKEFDQSTVAEMLQNHYDIDKELAERDASNILNDWKQIGIIE